jgi:hypothetical protein
MQRGLLALWRGYPKSDCYRAFIYYSAGYVQEV